MRMHAMMISGEKLVLLAMLVLATAARSDDEWPLVINADPAWQIQYQGDGIHFFSLTRPAGENVFFTFSKWPAPGGREQVSLLLKGVADGFAESQSTRLIPFAAPDSYELETIDGDDFSGEAAVFKHWDRSLLVLFMISDGDGIWDGQYSGSRQTWQRAKRVLQGLGRAGGHSPDAP
jgi:hypothetical protein